MLDLLPSELQFLILRLSRAILKRISAYDAKRQDLPWYVALNRWGIAPSMVYIIELIVCGFALIKIYRASRRLCYTLVTSAYPAICTAAALSSHDHETRHHWLTYWLIFSGFQGIDCCKPWIKPVFPPYSLAKVAVLGWAQHPFTFGARKVYRACFSKKKPIPRSGSPSANPRGSSRPQIPSSDPLTLPTTPVAGPLPQAAYIEEENVWTSDLETSASSATSPGSPSEPAAAYLNVADKPLAK